MAALGVMVFPLILAIGVLVCCVAASYFLVSEDKRVGCLATSGGLLLVLTVTVLALWLGRITT
ncbi:hypothetical protein ABT024_24175 [Streptomyces sp. NPDC002812]|uniref:hypothetical protein n=1 Tax=unclassified Streptomyces TaxID=2593676 RepID=UPI00202F8A6C|nr:hypothetical protein [Streptomyces sp. G1]MCM1966013.1 hypothetical protein [Streptomyces sp. G1]